MQTVTGTLRSEAEAIFTSHYGSILRRTDRLFAALLVAEWIGAVVAASILSPRTWIGDASAIHPHVWLAVILGAFFAGLGVAAALLRPASVLSRHAVAAAQMLMTGLLIHITDGRLETHFLVFGSLAFLAFYRDWRVLVTASLVTAADHLLRGIFLPQSVYGVLAASAWRTAEHAGWVVFSDVFLAVSCIQGIREMRQISERRAQLEETNRNIEALVAARTAELAASDERFRLFMENSPVAAVIKDEDGGRVWMNELGARLTDEFLQWREHLAPGDLRRFEIEIRRHDEAVLAAGHAMQWDEVVETAAGTRHFLTSRFPFTSAGGRTFVGAAAVDVTERFEYEARLSEARDAALEAARLKSEFLANMSHEIRTPMNGVMGMTQLLLDTPLDAEQQRYAESVKVSADHLLTVVNDILDLSKIEAGKLELESVGFDLRDTLEGTLEVLAPAAQKKGIEIGYAIHPGTPTAVCGDPGRLRQIVMNLASNAVKFTEAGEVMITAGLLETAGEVHRLEIQVRDSGIGIEPAALSRLFQPFTQADGSTTRRFGGTGLGLAITKELAERMNGTVTAESRPGVGTTFRCVVELKEAPEPQESDASGLRGLRVLVVDDHSGNRLLLQELLSRHGVEVKNAPEAESAAGFLATAADAGTPFDLVVLDMLLPKSDGLTLAGAIRGHGGIAAMPIVILTPLAERIAPEVLAALGNAGCLSKPFRQSVLLGEIRRATGRAAATLSAPAAGTAPARRSLRVLIADDNAINREVAAAQVRKLGHVPELVRSGIEVLAVMAERRFDVVLMDCHMPEMDGYAATREIRAAETREGRPPVRVVALTASAMEADRELCHAAGMDDFVSKPFELERLREVLDRVLTSSGEASCRTTCLDAHIVEELRDLADDDPAFLADLLGRYQEEAEATLEALTASAGQAAADRVQAAAHSLGGASASVGAVEVAGACRALEAAARRGATDALESSVVAVRLAYKRLVPFLEASYV